MANDAQNAPNPAAAMPMFAVNAEGQLLTRERVCACGRRYVQQLLSERWLAAVEAHGGHAIDAVLTDIPGLWVPVWCPSCERIELGRHARMHEFSSHPNAGGLPDAAD